MAPRLLPLAALALLVGGCDFTVPLDIDVPAHEPAAVISAVLATDSVAVVRLGVSTDPYRSNRYSYGPLATREDAVVTLLRDGQPVETLAVRSERCEDYNSGYDPQTGRPLRTFECGPFAGRVPLEAGATYTVRAEIPGLPPAEGSVTMPRAPTITAEELAPVAGDFGGERRRFRVRVQDAAGRGDRYGVSVLRGPNRYEGQYCDPPDYTVCRDTVYVDPSRYLSYFESSDPVIVSAARDVPGSGTSFVSVDDQTFDGQAWTFTVTIDDGYYYGPYGGDSPEQPLAVQVAALSESVYEAFLADRFGSNGDDNPFVEPTNRPSNVAGGFGLVGGVALAEVVFEGERPGGARAPAARAAAR